MHNSLTKEMPAGEEAEEAEEAAEAVGVGGRFKGGAGVAAAAGTMPLPLPGPGQERGVPRRRTGGSSR